MTVRVANTDITNTFDYWRNRTNELAYAMSAQVVTCNSDPTNGNTAINGDVQANTVTIGFSPTSKVTIPAPTPAEISSGYFLSANGTWSSIESGNKSGVVSDTRPTIIDSWSTTSFAAAEYNLHLKATNSNSYSYSKISVLHDTTSNSYVTEYAILLSNTQVATVSSNINAGIVRLFVAPLVSGAYYKFSRSVL